MPNGKTYRDSSDKSQITEIGSNFSVNNRALNMDLSTIRAGIADLQQPVYLQQHRSGQIILSDKATVSDNREQSISAWAPPLPVSSLGDPSFKKWHRCQAAFYAGAMANGISSAEMVITLGKMGLLCSYGSGGVNPSQVEADIRQIQAALPQGPYAVNLLNSPFEPDLEEQTVEILLKNEVNTIEASAYLGITKGLVWYRARGLKLLPDGEIEIRNHIIAKLSRKEVARRFLQPAPEKLLAQLVENGQITPQQAQLASHVPMADDITVEADSGGHTDNRPLVCLLPTIIAERDQAQRTHNYPNAIRIGVAGGISTPEAALAALMAGAAYVVTGSVNQGCVEAATSEKTRQLLAQVDMAEVIMAPAADMFEMGVKVQVLKRGTMFAMRAAKLYEVYRAYDCIENISASEREHIEEKILKRSFEDVWQDTVAFFDVRDPRQIERAEKDPKHKMALIFRWYLGLSSRWAIQGAKEREMDYQIWCGPAMGAFNDWVRGTYLEKAESRKIVDVTMQILTGAAYLYRLRILEAQGIQFPQGLRSYIPKAPLMID